MGKFHAVNVNSQTSGDLAPVIYNVFEDGTLGSVYMSWQRPDGYSANGSLRADDLACNDEIARLRAAGHIVSQSS